MKQPEARQVQSVVRANHPNGYPIVLTASAIEMSDFKLNPFIAFTGGFPSKIVPRWLLRKKWYPPAPNNPDGSIKFAPYGLRKIESLLIDEFGGDNVVTTHPNNLSRFVGPDTVVVGISSMDPLGIGFVSRTYSAIVGMGGEPMAAAEFKALMRHPVFKRYAPKILLGGAGAWQVARVPAMQKQFGIDTIVMGESERTCIELFRKAMNRNKRLPSKIVSKKPRVEDIPVIKHASLYGTVEITRGCGRGCQFCSPTMRRRVSFPLKHILEEVKLNASAGTRMIILQTDDIFLYQTRPRFVPNREAIYKLINSVANTDGVEYIQIAHAALAPVVVDPVMIEAIAPILIEKSRWKYNGKRYANFEIGLETGSTRLMEKYMRGKMLPYKPEEWQNIVVDAIGILNDNMIYPLGTLITGLPGESESDTIATLEMVDKLKSSKLFYVPLLFTSEEDCLLHKMRHADLSHCTELQWELFVACWKHNIRTFGNNIHRYGLMIFSLPIYPMMLQKHGKRILYPMLKFTGWSDTFIGRWLAKRCEPKFCYYPPNSRKG
jgi:radical SAM superfamily enzyme YgiQ (UPF0313 family)